MKKLIYIIDPHCGWSYANKRAVIDLFDFFKEEYDYEILSGGMWTGKNQRRGGEAMYDFILPNVIRINEFHDTEISGAYLDLVKDQSYLLSSDWPSRAMSAVNKISSENVLLYTYNLMNQQFQHGNRYDVERTYTDALEGLNIDIDSFKKQWVSEEIFADSENMFQRAKKYTSVYPSLILQHEKGFKMISKGVFDLAEAIHKIQREERLLRGIKL